MDTGAHLRDVGMKLAEDAQENNAPGWRDRAFSAIQAIAGSQSTVHVDDVRAIFIEQPHHPNAWGAVWMRALKTGVLGERVGTHLTQDAGKHKHRYPIYKSLICEALAGYRE